MKKVKPKRAKRDFFRRPVKRVLVVHRWNSQSALTLARDIAAWLKARKIAVVSHPEQRLGKGIPAATAGNIRKVDLAVVLGGDGTYLSAVRLLQDANIPILGVNLGSLGFLTVVRAEDAFDAIEHTLNGKMQLRRRSLISVDVRRGGKSREHVYALNDAVLERGPQSQLINLSIYIERQLTAPVKADGLIIATPTGSTAYNLAAGGPILHPDVAALVVTPICPHSLTNRPLIVPDRGEMLLRLPGKNQRAILTVDGRKVTELTSEDEIVIQRAGHDHFVMRKPTDNYFNLLREKLKFGERA
jgi:NAD+ kinase